MSNSLDQLANLSPEAKRALLSRLLQQKAQHPIHAPASVSQERMWLLHQLNPENTALNLPLTLKMQGNLDRGVVEQTLNEIVRRHQVLRTGFAIQDGQLAQVIYPSITVPIHWVDLEQTAEQDREAKAQELIRGASDRIFDLAQPPFLRVLLVQLDSQNFMLHLMLHHVICDGWSMTVLGREFSAIYAALITGKPSPLPALDFQYADYARWQRDWLQGPAQREQLDYWKKQLANSPAFLELPSDYARPATRTFRGEQVAHTLDPELTHALKLLGQRENATLFMVMLAAFQLLLSRLSGQPDISVGSPIAGRTRAEIEGLIGVFINNLVMRTDVSGDPTFHDLLQRVRAVALGAYAHQEVPFEKVVEELHPERNPSYSPLFQVMFNMLSFGSARVELPGLAVEFSTPVETSSNFDMTCYCAEQNGKLDLLLVYNADLYDRARMTELLNQYQSLLDQIIQQPEANISRYSLVTSHARAILPQPTIPLAIKWAGSIPSRLAQQAKKSPEQIALSDQFGAWTYRELDLLSDRLASYLRAHGILPHTCVAVYAHRSASFVLALLGIMKAGAAFVILDPAYPVASLLERLRAIELKGWIEIEQAGTLPAELEEFLNSVSVCRLRLSASSVPLHKLLDESRLEASPLSTEPNDLAYVAFTSGSTGNPKGILGEHRSLCHFLEWHSQTFGFAPADHFSMLSGLAHDPLMRDIFTPLWNGATLCIPSQEEIETPGRLSAWMRQEKITVVHLTPAMSEILTTNARRSEEAFTLDSLRYGFFVGDTLTRRHLTGLRTLAPSVACVNFYGATETPQAMAYKVIGDDFLQPEHGYGKDAVPIGKGIQDVQLLVLNSGQQLTGIGEVGEICIRTPYLARGYLNDDVLTQERFTVNPFTQMPGDRMYRTGDLGRYLPNGDIEFLGRRDLQVKIRGFRVELGEIEGALAQHPAMREVVVIVREDTPREKQLVAYVVPVVPQKPNHHELRAFLAERLPNYMIPVAFVVLETIPLSPNGKIDRRALPIPDTAIFETSGTFLAPRTPIEETLVTIWTEVLRAERIGMHDNFFELGGHSLLATLIVSRVRQIFKIELPIRVLFEHPTIAGMADQVEINLQAEHPQPPSLVPVKRDSPIPLSYSQERMWFIHQLNPASSAYNMGSAMRWQGYLHVDAFQKSLDEIVRRHEALRTTFVVMDGQPVQIISPTLKLDIPIVDLSNRDVAEREQRALGLVNEQMRRPFDLEQGPLVRFGIYRLAEHDHIITSTMHHIITDAWSSGVILRELIQLYPAFTDGVSPTLGSLPIQYADFAYWQRTHLKDQALSAQLDYWRNQLAGIHSLELPTDHPRPPIQTTRGHNVILDLDASVFGGLERLSRQASATFFMTVLAAFQILLYRYTHQEDVAIGVPIANRKWLAIENLVGTFVNTLVIRTDLSGSPTFRELLERVRQVALDAYAHQDISFAHLVAELHPERDTSHAPFFQVLFNVINVPVPQPTLPDVAMTFLSTDRQGAQFDLSVTVTNLAGIKNVIVNYNTDLFDEATARRLMHHYNMLLHSIAANPEQPISQLAMLDEPEKQKILFDWNDTRRAYPQDQCVHQLFAAQVARTPEAIAVIGESLATGREEQLTYHELAGRVNQLAHYLQKRGVGPEVRVGISMHRTIDMLVGVLGVLQAGGAYLPLDPAFPKDRLSFMAQDAQIPVLLTEQSLVADLPAHSAQVVCLDTDWVHIAQESIDTPASDVTPHHLAYILYTSGSTGKPKGVQVLHRALTNFIVAMQNEPGLSADDTLLSVTTLSFDIAGLELYLPLITGARVVIATRETLADGRLLAEKIASTRTTVMQATPATWRMLLESGWQGHSNLKILCGGEALARDLADALLDRCGSLWNMYGPTETTIWSTLQHVERNKPIAVGRPIANTTIYILDANLQPVPIGIPGNLYIGGDGLARGYLNRPELNAERFVRDPFSADPAAHMYMTGDVARYLPNGEIDYLGRSDTQVKVRGFRIELGEIESALTLHPAIRQAVLVAHEFRAGDKRLVAYILPASGAVPSASDLRVFLKDRLPEYMVPSVFVTVDKFPLTPNGKVDRKALPRPEQTQADAHTFVEPRTKLEKQLAQIWEDVLGTHLIGVQDDFFNLGGHSLLGVQLFARIENMFGKRLPLATLFQASTIEQLAQLLPQHNDRVPGSSLVAIQPAGSRPPFYCIHEYDGNVLYYRELALHLGKDQPFYGLQAKGLDGQESPLTRFEDIAAHYIKEIRTAQPQGPYFLGGSSLGGVVAFEVAQQLVAQGQSVALLALFDTWSPGYLKLLQLPLPHVFARHAEALSQLAFKDKLHYFTRRVVARLNPSKWFNEQYARLVWGVKHYGCQVYLNSRRPLPHALLDFYIRETMIRAQKNYTPKPYPGRVTFFLAEDKPATYYHAPRLDRESLVAAGFCSTKDVDALWQEVYPMGWGALAAGGLEIIEVPGTHAFLVREPHVRALAEKLRACIDQAEQSAKAA